MVPRSETLALSTNVEPSLLRSTSNGPLSFMDNHDCRSLPLPPAYRLNELTSPASSSRTTSNPNGFFAQQGGQFLDGDVGYEYASVSAPGVEPGDRSAVRFSARDFHFDMATL